MATTNMLQWNPTQANQETDAQYLADGQRSGGATDPSVFASVLANKLFNIVTNYWYAFASALAAKGYTTDDSNMAALQAVFANIVTNADAKGLLQYVPFASTLSFNCAAYNGFQVTLVGNLAFTLATPAVGQVITLAFTQDGVGGRTVSWPSNVVGYGTVDATAGATSMQRFEVLNDNLLHPAGPMTVS